MDNVLANLVVKIAANTAQFNTALAQSQKQFSSFTNTISRTASGLGIGLGIGALATVVGDAIGSMRDLERQMSTVKAITGATGKEFDALRGSALRLGSSTQFTALNVAQLQTEFGRLGFSTREILQATEATIQLATATGEDLAKSADTAGSTIRGFGLDASETQRVVDVMAESFNKSALGLSNFTEAMKYVAPIAKSANLSVEETTALLGTLADAGIRGSQAGTSLRKIITDLAKDGRPLAVRLKELADRGLSFAQANDEVGRTAYASLLVLTQNQKKTEELAKSLNNAEGAAKRAADIIGDNLSGDLREAAGAYDALVQSSSEAITVFREFVQAGTAVLRSLTAQDGILGSYVAKWLKLALIVPRTVASIVNGFADIGNATLQQQLDTVNTLLAREENFNPKQEDLDSVLKLLKISAEAAGKQLLVLRDQYGKVQIFIKENPIISSDNPLIDPNTITATFETIQSLEEEIKRLRKVQEEETPVGDVLGLQALEKKIEKVELRLAKLRFAIAGFKDDSTFIGKAISGEELSNTLLSDTKVTGGNVGTSLPQFSIRPVDGNALIKSLEKIKQIVSGYVSDIKEELLDIGPLISNAIAGFAAAIGESLAGTKDLGKELLAVVGDFAQQFGSLLIASGVGTLALQSGDPYLMIAGGAALVAIGAALSATAKRRSNISSEVRGGGSGRVNSDFSNAGSIQDREIKVVGQVIMRGQDAYIMLKNYENGQAFTNTMIG